MYWRVEDVSRGLSQGATKNISSLWGRKKKNIQFITMRLNDLTIVKDGYRPNSALEELKKRRPCQKGAVSCLKTFHPGYSCSYNISILSSLRTRTMMSPD